MPATSFSPIQPAPARDFFLFDFTQQIGSGTIISALWDCVMSPVSEVIDSDPKSRIVGTPSFAGMQTSALCGDMIDGAVYSLSTSVTINDGRVFIRSADLLCSSMPGAQLPIVVIGGVVQFDYNEWVNKFPEFQMLDPDQAQEYWAEAGLLFRNDSTCPETDVTIRREILDLLTAHCASLFAPAPVGRGGSSMVGIITSKSVNGVSLSGTPFGGVSGTAQWYLQSQYGAKAWKLMAAYRTMHYLPPLYAHLPRRASLPYPYSWRW